MRQHHSCEPTELTRRIFLEYRALVPDGVAWLDFHLTPELLPVSRADGCNWRASTPERFPHPEALARVIQQAQQEWNLPSHWLGASACRTF